MYRHKCVSALAMVAMAAILTPSALTAQITFQRTYGGASYDYGFSVQQTADGGYVVAGGTGSFGAGDCDLYLVKVNALGDTQWTRTYGGAGSQIAYSGRQTADGGYILAGGVEWSGSFAKVYLVRTDASGETLWTKTFGRDSQEIQEAEQVRQTSDGGFVFTGQALGYVPDKVSFVVRTDANGDSLWAREFGGPDSGDCLIYSVQQTTDRGYILCGWVGDTVSHSYDAYLVKLDSVGGTMWTAAFGDTGMQKGYWVEQTTNGGYIMVGVADYSDLSDDEDVYLVRTDANGNALWSSVLREAGDQCGSEVHETSDGGYALSGWTDPTMTDSFDAYLAYTDADGDTLWTRTFGGDSDDIACSFEQTEDGGYIIAGYTKSFGASGDDVYLIKTDSLGNVGVADPKPNSMRMRGMTVDCEPNPCRGMTTISLKPQAASSEPVSLRVYNASGRLVHSTSGIRNSPFQLDLRSLPSGAYFVRLDAGEESSAAVLLKL